MYMDNSELLLQLINSIKNDVSETNSKFDRVYDEISASRQKIEDTNAVIHSLDKKFVTKDTFNTYSRILICALIFIGSMLGVDLTHLLK